jgi:hypothetical protein
VTIERLLFFWFAGWRLVLPLTVAATIVAAFAARRRRVRTVIYGAVVLLAASSAWSVVYGVLEADPRYLSWRGLAAGLVGGAPTVIGTALAAWIQVRRRAAPVGAAIVTFLGGVLVMPVSGFAILMAACMMGDCL